VPSALPALPVAGEGALGGTVPRTLTRAMLGSGCTAVGQVDAEFVPAVCSYGDTKVLVVVDQHAADERILLEELQAKVAAGDPDIISSVPLRPPLRVFLGAGEVQALERFREKVTRWGWAFGATPRAAQGASDEVLLTAAPRLLGATLRPSDLRAHLVALHETAGGAGTPAGLQRVLASKACRGAIMFGDALQPAECQRLLDRLAGTELCFDCAHGRPTMAPLLDLRAVAGAGSLTPTPRGSSRDTPEQRLTVADLKRKLAAAREAKAVLEQEAPRGEEPAADG